MLWSGILYLLAATLCIQWVYIAAAPSIILLPVFTALIYRFRTLWNEPPVYRLRYRNGHWYLWLDLDWRCVVIRRHFSFGPTWYVLELDAGNRCIQIVPFSMKRLPPENVSPLYVLLGREDCAGTV